MAPKAGKQDRFAKAVTRLVDAQAKNPHAFTGRTLESKLPLRLAGAKGKGTKGLTATADKQLRARLVAMTEVARAGGHQMVTLDTRTGGVAPSGGNVNPDDRIHATVTSAQATFTPRDYAALTSAQAGEAGAIIAVGAQGVAILQAPRGGRAVWPAPEHVQALLADAYGKRLGSLRAAQAKAMQGKVQRTKDALAKVTEADALGAAWKDVARQTGMTYKRVGLTSRRVFAMDLMDGPMQSMQSGYKTAEGRLVSKTNLAVRPGDLLHFTSKQSGAQHSVEVTNVTRHSDAAAMVRARGLKALGFSPQYGDTIASAADVYAGIYDWMYARGRQHPGYLAYGVKNAGLERANTPLTKSASTGTKASTSKGTKGKTGRGKRNV